MHGRPREFAEQIAVDQAMAAYRPERAGRDADERGNNAEREQPPPQSVKLLTSRYVAAASR